jgi:hypothetical protein
MADTSLQPDQIKKLLKLKQILADNKKLSPEQRRTIYDEGMRRLKAQDTPMKALAADYDKSVPFMQRGLGQVMENAATGGFKGPNPPVNPVLQAGANLAVPPDATSAAIEGGMMATGMGPGGRLLGKLPAAARLLGEYGLPMLAGREVAPLEGRTPTSGEGQAAGQVGMGKLLAGGINLLGKQGEKADAARVTKDLGAYIKSTLPHFSGKLQDVKDFAYAFVRGGAKKQIDNTLSQTEKAIEKHLGPQVGPVAKLTLPTLHDTLVDMGWDPKTTPDEFTFPQAMKLYRKVRNQGYQPTGDIKVGTDYQSLRNLRMSAHQVRDEVVSELNALAPGSGDMLDDVLREDAATHAYTNMVHDLNKAGMSRGRMPVDDLQTLLNTGRDQGYVEDFDRIWGNPQRTDDLIKASQRGAAAHTGTDAPRMAENMRLYGNPAKPGSVHMGLPLKALQSLLGKHRVGSPTRAFPKISGTVPGMLLSGPAKFIGEAESGAYEGEPVDTGATP